ncbi:MAG: hypothetical protein ACC652_13350, partial [Acidimicrobiales bacterium]
GVWALASALVSPLDAAEIAESGVDPKVLVPGEFAIYAGLVGATLLLSHWLIGFVWPAGWKPRRRSSVMLVVVAGLYMSVVVLPGVIWAPLKLAVLIGGTWRLLRRPVSESARSQSSILDQLAGRVRLRHAAILMVMPAAAALSYEALWQFRGRILLLETMYWGLVTLQIVAGASAFVWAWRRSRVTGRSPEVITSSVTAS